MLYFLKKECNIVFKNILIILQIDKNPSYFFAITNSRTIWQKKNK